VAVTVVEKLGSAALRTTVASLLPVASEAAESLTHHSPQSDGRAGPVRVFPRK
jgi:hypothetical protein